MTVDAVAAVDRRGAFAERGYTSSIRALSDLLGWEAFEARRRVVAAEQVTSRIGLDGAVLPARRSRRRDRRTAVEAGVEADRAAHGSMERYPPAAAAE